MKSEILFQGSYALLKIDLEQGEEIKAEPGAMVGMSDSITMKVKKSGGGFFKSLKAKFLGGESFFNTYFKAEGKKGQLLLAPKAPGSIAQLNLDGTTGYILEKGAFLASSPEVKLDVKFQGFAKGLFNREGFFLIKVDGDGKLFLNCFGGLHKISLDAGEKFIIDNGHLVAFSSNTDYRITKAGGWVSSIISGEGVVLEFTGPGIVYLQSRNPDEFGRWILPFIPIPTSSGGKRSFGFGRSENSTMDSYDDSIDDSVESEIDEYDTDTDFDDSADED